ncbi:adenylate/guanylate cyclase domain-containing protein [Treponema sp.]
MRSLAKPSPMTGSIKSVMLDQGSLDWGSSENGLSWPWPREVYAPIVSFLSRSGAKTLSFDVLYTEPSVYGVGDDESLGSAIAESGNFIAAAAPSRDSGLDAWPQDLTEPKLRLVGTPPPELVFPKAVFPIPEISQPSAMLASVISTPDSDGVNRRLALFSIFDGRVIPSLALAAYCLEKGITEILIEKGQLRLGSLTVPLDEKGRAIIRYRGPSQTHEAVNAAAVIQAELGGSGVGPVDPTFFKDTRVFFGFTALGLFDLRPSPLGSAYPGMEIHTSVLDNLLSGDFIAPLPRSLEALLIALFALAAGIGLRLMRHAMSAALVFIGLTAAPIAVAWALYLAGYWAPLVAPLTAVLVSLLAALVLNYAGEGRQKRFIKGAFSQYLSPVVIDQLVQNPELLTLGGEKRRLSILFSDIRGFTSISEKLDPVALTGLLNDYLSEVTGIIYDHGGTIDKYEGDAVIAFWNAPLDLPNHAEQAVRAALIYQRRLAEIRPRLRATAGSDVYARIGINTGDVVIGNMGSVQRFNYTFLGDAGNLAARLEGINKQFGSFLMVSEATKTAAGEHEDLCYRELSQVTVVGKKQPVRVFEPFFRDDYEQKRGLLESFDTALKLYYKGDFKQARDLFALIERDDAPASSYCRRLDELLQNPPSNWDGVWAVTEK